MDIMVVTFKKPEETQTKRLSWRVNYAKYIGRQTITQKEFKSEYESYTNTNDTNISKMQSAITQNAESVSVVAKKFNDDGTLKNTSGLLTTADASGLFAVDGDGNLKSLVESSQEGVKIKADGNITLEGFTTINDNFKVLTDGSIEANNATISGTVNATEGSIGGFSLSQGKIGVGSDNDATEGLGITNNYLRFASSKQKVLLGCLSTYGSPYNGYFSLTAEDGTTLEVHHDIPSGYEQYEHLSLYRPKALEVYGNIYAKGKQAIFEKGYIGTAYSDTIQQWFPLTHKFQFESNSVTDSGKYLQLFLPSKTAINSLMSNDTVMFDLEIVCGSGMTNYIAIQPDTGKTTTLFRPRHMKITYDYDIDLGKYVYAPSIVSAGTIESYKMYAGDHLRLRYCNGVYYMCTDRIETKYFTGGDLE